MNGMYTDVDLRDKLTRSLIGCAFAVANGLGTGFLEKVYENALAITLRNANIGVAQQCALDIRFEGHVVGTCIADFVVESAVIVQLKAVHALNSAHVAQCLTLLKASGMRTCALLNFGKQRPEIRRLAGPV